MPLKSGEKIMEAGVEWPFFTTSMAFYIVRGVAAEAKIALRCFESPRNPKRRGVAIRRS
jgi:hypothetical protein